MKFLPFVLSVPLFVSPFEISLDERLSEHVCRVIQTEQTGCIEPEKRDRMCSNFVKKSTRKLQIENDPKTENKMAKCNGNTRRFQALIDALKREWLLSDDPSDWIYKMVLLNIEAKYPNCNIIDKGRVDIINLFIFL